jgi:predicted nuclease of restriction endonuclease-like RecB superfamily
MLTKEHAIAEYKNNEIKPDRLVQKIHTNYPGYAEQMVGVYKEGTGKTRRELHKAVHKIFEDEPDCPVRRIDAFCKLLDDACVYSRDIPGKAANLRKKVFRLSAGFHPLVKQVNRFFENSETDVKAKIAVETGKTWEDIERDLFADVTEYHRLIKFAAFDPARGLLSRYNVAQLQAALYRAVEMVVWAGKDFKTILRYAKLARLMHTIERLSGGAYRIRFDGPASVLRNTRRYGVSMAKFLPALIACDGWRMWAKIATRRKGYYVSLNISSKDKFKSNLPSFEDFDSSVEEGFAEKWGDETRSGWSLIREGEILWKGQKVFLPDFALLHEDGRAVLLEIVGFWTPQYLKEKVKTLQVFEEHNILLAVAESLVDKLPPMPMQVITYKKSILLKDVLSYLESMDC